MKNGVVTAGHPQTAWAAARILEEGGNAFDAAVAALLAACVNEYCMSSLGGGFFANVYTSEHQSFFYDAFCQTPIQKRPVKELDFYPISLDLGETTEEFHIGLGSIGTPGTVAGIFALYKDHCTIPFEKLIEPAIHIARNGSIIDDFQAFDYRILEPMLRVHPDSSALFIREDRTVREGEKVKFSLFADFLERLAKEGEELFYKGEIAQKIAKDSRENGGYLNLQDFENYEVIKGKPLRFSYKNKQILTNPLPSIGGPMIAMALHYLEKYKAVNFSSDKCHTKRLYELFKKMESTEHRTPDGLAQLLQETGIISELNKSTGYTQKRGNTTHLNVMDKHGNTIGITTSNGEGAGCMIEGTQIMLNNMLGEAALLPRGFHSWEPNVRLSSMMSPTIVLDASGGVDLVLGTGGAGRIPFAIMQTLHYYLDHKMSLEEAVHSPRVHLQEGVYNVEPPLPSVDDFLQDKDKLLPWVTKGMYFGGVNAIATRPNTFPEAVGDFRRSAIVVYS